MTDAARARSNIEQFEQLQRRVLVVARAGGPLDPAFAVGVSDCSNQAGGG